MSQLGQQSHPWEDTDSVLGENDSHCASRCHDPIVVAYAFGPKKMKSMGVVMAEASRVPVIHEEEEEESFYRDDCHSEGHSLMAQNNPADVSEDGSVVVRTTTATSTATTHRPHSHPSLTSAALAKLEPPSVTSTILTYGNENDTNLNDIVRYFRSSCSSVASRSETTVSTPTTCTTFNSSHSKRSANNSSAINPRRSHPVRISFVPLDPDVPLEEQHGGHFDLILHKLTEDILTCSLWDNHSPNSDKEASLRRVQSLKLYQQNTDHTCCLVDDPDHVQTLMSRANIACVLKDCLLNVRSTSGIPVKTPNFVCIDQYPTDIDNPGSHVENMLQSHSLSAPLIVKPLVAAGTKESHFMAILLGTSAFSKVPPRSIIQEYVNHNAILYKVYVLGEHVYVYPRPSLPNLPIPLPRSESTEMELLEFDSQRPYPRLQDFGIDFGMMLPEEEKSKRGGSMTIQVTPDEVRPIVESLKEAFGLQLFGFDILLSEDEKEWLVVDVNYFPSYKEVPNFPTLLAHYLTQRVLEERRKEEES